MISDPLTEQLKPIDKLWIAICVSSTEEILDDSHDYFIHLIDYHQLSDIDPIDSSYMVLNNTINESDLWQQGALSQFTVYRDSSQEIYFHLQTHVCNGKWLVSMCCDVLHAYLLLQSAVVNSNKAIQWLGRI